MSLGCRRPQQLVALLREREKEKGAVDFSLCETVQIEAGLLCLHLPFLQRPQAVLGADKSRSYIQDGWLKGRRSCVLLAWTLVPSGANTLDCAHQTSENAEAEDARLLQPYFTNFCNAISPTILQHHVEWETLATVNGKVISALLTKRWRIGTCEYVCVNTLQQKLTGREVFEKATFPVFPKNIAFNEMFQPVVV